MESSKLIFYFISYYIVDVLSLYHVFCGLMDSGQLSLQLRAASR